MRVPPESSGRLIVHDDLTRNPSTHDLKPTSTACPRSILWPVLVVALIANTLSLAASQLWLFPDSRWYLQLAAQIADRGDFSNDLFLIRTPGYPLLLAGIFRLFGSSSPAALLVLQHAMIVGVALLTTATAWHATPPTKQRFRAL